ncbi:hypothetical protein EV421DRAFT_1987208 [Armillaria borealis]|uniref:Uncharacterized protein n=1 Tax=Armillaria borealis TaxID=47425 RepID=A0AA39J358_9AGAR|nr:hypothetical protein EV421DRAFT_1987208 [Armillaria borealis]
MELPVLRNVLYPKGHQAHAGSENRVYQEVQWGSLLGAKEKKIRHRALYPKLKDETKLVPAALDWSSVVFAKETWQATIELNVDFCRGGGPIRILEKCNLRRRGRPRCQQSLKEDSDRAAVHYFADGFVRIPDLRDEGLLKTQLSLQCIYIEAKAQYPTIVDFWTSSDDGSATVGWEVLIGKTIAKGASRCSLATSCWVEVKETLEDPSELEVACNFNLPRVCGPNLYDWTRTGETESHQSHHSRLVPPKWDELHTSPFKPQGLMPQDISRTVLGLSAGRSDTCKRFLTTIYTEKTSPNIDIDFLGAGRRWGDSSRRNRPKQRLLARGTRVMLHGGPARCSGVLAIPPASS